MQRLDRDSREYKDVWQGLTRRSEGPGRNQVVKGDRNGKAEMELSRTRMNGTRKARNKDVWQGLRTRGELRHGSTGVEGQTLLHSLTVFYLYARRSVPSLIFNC